MLWYVFVSSFQQSGGEDSVVCSAKFVLLIGWLQPADLIHETNS